MSSYGSSAITKSNKKLAPKAPPQRRRIASTEARQTEYANPDDVTSTPLNPHSKRTSGNNGPVTSAINETIPTGAAANSHDDVTESVMPEASRQVQASGKKRRIDEDSSVPTKESKRSTNRIKTKSHVETTTNKLMGSGQTTNGQNSNVQDIEENSRSSLPSQKSLWQTLSKNDTNPSHIKPGKERNQDVDDQASMATPTSLQEQQSSTTATNRSSSSLVSTTAAASRRNRVKNPEEAAVRTRNHMQRELVGSREVDISGNGLQKQITTSSNEAMGKRPRGRPRKAMATKSSASSDPQPKQSEVPEALQATVVEGENTDGIIASADLANEVENNEHDQEDNPSEKRARRRATTPSDAGDHEIDTIRTTMDELCKSSKLGQKSQLETDFQAIDWNHVARKRKEADAVARRQLEDAKRGIRDQEHEESHEEPAQQEVPQNRGPQLRVVNGEIILDNNSLTVDSHAAGVAGGTGIGEAEEETDLTRRINNRTWMFDNKRDPVERHPAVNRGVRWSTEETDHFYDALRMFGTDFLIISKMFPGLTRTHIKRKFAREEKEDPGRINEVLLNSKPMEMEYYCRATGWERGEFKDPRTLDQELKEAEEAQRNQIEDQKKQAVETARKKQEAAKEKAKQAEERKARRQKKKRSRGVDSRAAGEDSTATAYGTTQV